MRVRWSLAAARECQLGFDLKTPESVFLFWAPANGFLIRSHASPMTKHSTAYVLRRLWRPQSQKANAPEGGLDFILNIQNTKFVPWIEILHFLDP